MPGSESVADVRTVHSGTWENRNVPKEASREAEEATREYVVAGVVGPTRSRGVGRAEKELGVMQGISRSLSATKARNCAPLLPVRCTVS